MSTDWYLACDNCVKRELAAGAEAPLVHVHRDPDFEDDVVARTAFGGATIGLDVKFVIPERMVRPDIWVTDGNEAITTEQLLARKGKGKAE